MEEPTSPSAPAGVPSDQDDIEARVQRVVNGLLPETAFRDQYDPPASLADRMAHYHTPGVSVAVVDDGRIAWARGFGVRQNGRPEPVTARTLFQAGSISKPIFALAVMRLVHEARLDLDEDVNRYLTSWRVPANGTWQPRVTLRQILSHSAGLTVHGFPGYGTGEAVPSVVALLNGAPPANTPAVLVNIVPGVQFRYSGGGTTVAQLLVTDVLGEPFPALMRALILDPLGMADSTYEQPLPEPWVELAATAHPWKGRPLPGGWHVYPEMAAAGLWTTPSDLARAGIAMQRALAGDGAGSLTPATAAAMLTPSPASEGIGLGFFLEGKGAGQRFGHGGWDEGFVAQMCFYRDRGQGAVVMVNSNEGAPLMGEILRAVAREYAWAEYFSPSPAADPATGALDEYTGVYATRSLDCSVAGAGGQLWFTIGQQPAIELQPVSRDVFRAVGVNAEVVFNRVEEVVKSLVVFNRVEKVVKSLTLTQDGTGTMAERR